MPSGKWFELCILRNSSANAFFINGILNNSQSAGGGSLNPSVTQSWYVGANVKYSSWSFIGTMNDLSVYNYALTPRNITDRYNKVWIPPSIIKINLTSGNGGVGDTSSPYTTNDTTPTFAIETDRNAICAIDNEDLDYMTMITEDILRNCSTTDGVNHVCTLQPSDGLIINETTGNAYIACKNSYGIEKSDALTIALTEIEATGEEAIETGIKQSNIGATATIYTNQQVYLRDLDNNQVLATFDKVALYDLQRWAFNYLTSTESPISGLFNLTTAFYAAEYQYMTFKEVNESVRDFIDNTVNP